MSQQIQVFIPSISGSGKFAISFSKNSVMRTFFFLALIIIASSLAFAIFLNKQTLNTDMALDTMSQKSTELLTILEDLETQRTYLDNLISDKQIEFSQQLELNDIFLDQLSQRMANVEELLDLEAEGNETGTITQRLDQAALLLLVKKNMLKVIPNGSPLKVATETSGYGSRTHPVTGNEKFHLGLDLTARIGTPVYATADGVVEHVRASKKRGYGNMLKIEHTYGFMTLFAHLDRFNVETGQFIKKGDLIAWSGNTGLSTGPHLHYEVRFVGRALDPNNFIKWTSKDFNSLFQREKRVNWASLVEVIETSVLPNFKLTTDMRSSLNVPPTSAQPKTLLN